MTKHADLKRRIRARMAKTGESYTTARVHVLADRLSQGDPGASMAEALHVTNGDATVPALKATGLAQRRIVVWRDVLHEGPVPDVPDDQLLHRRAAFLAGEYGHPDAITASFIERDAVLEAFRYGEYVLWFEADLYDQLQLVQILARLSALSVHPEQITLICVGEHVEVAHFRGLGELNAGQLGRLATTSAIKLSADGLEHATSAWAAFRAPDPTGIATVATTPSRDLRFVAEAFDRLGREYPSTRDGMALSERRILAAVADGAQTAGEAFIRAAAREARPFLGDTSAFDRIAGLSAGPSPLLKVGLPPVERDTSVQITKAGRQVLAGEADRIALNGIDRWIGGVHLTGHQVRWRWNEATESLTTG